MSVVGVATVKDEADVIAGVVRHMAGQVDWLLVCDNGSTDGTREILEGLTPHLPLVVVDDPELGYYQARRMTQLAELAADKGADWVVPFDADELWTALAADGVTVADLVAGAISPVVSAQLVNYLRTAIDPPDPDPFRSMVWRQARPAPLGKVAFRWEEGAQIWQGNHGVTLPSYDATPAAGLAVAHFPARSASQFTRKGVNGAAAYAAAGDDLDPGMGVHWRSYGQLIDASGSDAVLGDVFREHWWYLSPVDAGLVCDPARYAPAPLR